jgi:hypothetical protein
MSEAGWILLVVCMQCSPLGGDTISVKGIFELVADCQHEQDAMHSENPEISLFCIKVE